MEEINLSLTSFLNELELIWFHATISIVSTQWNGFKNCNLTFMILFNFDYLFTEAVSSIAF